MMSSVRIIAFPTLFFKVMLFLGLLVSSITSIAAKEDIVWDKNYLSLERAKELFNNEDYEQAQSALDSAKSGSLSQSYSACVGTKTTRKKVRIASGWTWDEKKECINREYRPYDLQTLLTNVLAKKKAAVEAAKYVNLKGILSIKEGVVDGVLDALEPIEISLKIANLSDVSAKSIIVRLVSSPVNYIPPNTERLVSLAGRETTIVKFNSKLARSVRAGDVSFSVQVSAANLKRDTTEKMSRIVRN